MNVRSIFRPWVVRVEGDDCLADTAERMQNEQVGSVVVAIGGRFVGILTERDSPGRSPTGPTPGSSPQPTT
jgi:predicted transcriptional regulator